MIDKKKIGAQLLDLRKSRGWTQEYVADRVGVNRSTVSNIERGTRSLTLETLRKFCDLFSVEVSYFSIEADADEVVDVLERLRTLFGEVSDSEREMMLREIMRYYLER